MEELVKLTVLYNDKDQQEKEGKSETMDLESSVCLKNALKGMCTGKADGLSTDQIYDAGDFVTLSGSYIYKIHSQGDYVETGKMVPLIQFAKQET